MFKPKNNEIFFQKKIYTLFHTPSKIQTFLKKLGDKSNNVWEYLKIMAIYPVMTKILIIFLIQKFPSYGCVELSLKSQGIVVHCGHDYVGN